MSGTLNFKVKKTCTFETFKKNFSQRINIPLRTLRFLCRDGRRLDDFETPESFGMKEGDDDNIIDVYLEQVAGGK